MSTNISPKQENNSKLKEHQDTFSFKPQRVPVKEHLRRMILPRSIDSYTGTVGGDPTGMASSHQSTFDPDRWRQLQFSHSVFYLQSIISNV
jgi:hypothetical protein